MEGEKPKEDIHEGIPGLRSHIVEIIQIMMETGQLDQLKDEEVEAISSSVSGNFMEILKNGAK